MARYVVPQTTQTVMNAAYASGGGAADDADREAADDADTEAADDTDAGAADDTDVLAADDTDDMDLRFPVAGCRFPPAGQFLRDRNARILFHGFEHNRRPRRDDRRRRGDLLAKDLSEVLRVAGAYFQQIAVLAGDVVDFENLRDARQLVGGGHVGTVLGGAHRDEREHAAVDDVRVDKGDVIPDNALGLEFAKAFEDGGGCKTNGLGELGLGRPRVVLKNIQN
jgi:hypothetical protein